MVYYKAARQYLRMVKRHLVCSNKNRARLMRVTNKAVNAYLDDEPNKPYDALVSAIGEPKAFAESLMVGISSDEVKRSRKNRRLRLCAALVLVSLILVSAFAFLINFYFKFQAAKDDGWEGYITTIPKPKCMTNEEFEEYLQYRDEKADRLWEEAEAQQQDYDELWAQQWSGE